MVVAAYLWSANSMTPEAIKKRDELAKRIHDDPYSMASYFDLVSMFDAGYSQAKLEAEELVKALERISREQGHVVCLGKWSGKPHDYPDAKAIYRIVEEALAKHRGSNE